MAAKRVRPKSKEEAQKPGVWTPGFTAPITCKFCGHDYWIPCGTEPKATKCRNVKLKDKKSTASKKKR